ncbi:FkbM family methyltransferase [Thermosulfurimonas dismutans]|uniref:Methyltransferase, FkbM family domain protein n=1 Tax=Thermosulfurimonas dismutans TaxID=999894 RepID=A0A179D691_9BACT|nr:FkbM family methyltransferase [Thermosulfurimonas dismutans]OAQ21128.1 methyltransferase, FkbM family domain protein [Thermosulfurimonas dismutans]
MLIFSNLYTIGIKILDTYLKVLCFLKIGLLKRTLKKKGVRFIVLRPKYFNKFSMILDLNDEGITNELLLARIREEHNVLFFRKFLENHKFDVIFDIGANIGFYCLLELENSLSNIVAVEPVHRNFELLKENLFFNNAKENIISKTFLIKKAVSLRSDEWVEIKIPSQGNWSSLKTLPFFKNFYLEKVQTISLETLINHYKTILNSKSFLVRMDVEGYEYELFCHFKDFFCKQKNYGLVLEVHPHIIGKKNTLKLLNTFKEFGGKLIKVIYDYPILFSLYFKNKVNLFKTLNPFAKQLEEIKDIDSLATFFEQSNRLFSFHMYYLKP